MTYDARKICPLCAWRANCAKRFSLQDSTLHCPDFSEDVQLRKEAEKAAGNSSPDGSGTE